MDMTMSHGAYALSKAVKAGKTLDRRTRMGRQMAIARDNLISECGGEPTQAQLILLDRILEKMVFLMAMSQFALDQEAIVDESGKLIPCLGQSYLSYSEALRRDLLAFKGLSDNGKGKNGDLTLEKVCAKYREPDDTDHNSNY